MVILALTYNTECCSTSIKSNFHILIPVSSFIIHLCYCLLCSIQRLKQTKPNSILVATFCIKALHKYQEKTFAVCITLTLYEK